MYKSLIISILFLATAWGYAQERVEKKFNAETNLVEATYYHDNGLVSQEGTFNTEGKLHGEWTSYNDQGEKITLGNYDNGLRTGKWYFWTGETLREVEFSNNQIASVTEAENSTGIVNH
jgi:antitoxin component YwqK of YwqJK toxin-antitoxin module